MKKLILSLIMFFSISELALTAENSIYIKGSFGLDKLSKSKGKNNGESMPFELSLEATSDYFDHIEIGFGVSYLHRGDQKFNYKDVKVFSKNGSTTPVYLIGKFNLLPGEDFMPFAKGTLGYSFNRANLSLKDMTDEKFSIKNSAFIGLGVGVEYNYFNVDLMYRIDYTKFKLDKETLNANLNTLMLGVGYRF